MDHPIDNLVRAWARPEAAQLRDATEGDGRTLFGHFAVFDQWTTIDSWVEGRFRERLAKGAFRDTMRDRRDQIRILYDHGGDPQVGNKPLAAPDVLREDATGAYYEARLFDATYVNDLVPAIRAGQMGASFRFRVTGESWVDPTTPTKDNPEMLSERTITAVDLYEFGPVTFPAYPEASAGLRSRTDDFVDRMLNDPSFVARLTERAGLKVVEKILANVSADGRTDVPEHAVTCGVTNFVQGTGRTGDPQQNPSATADGQTEESETEWESLPTDDPTTDETFTATADGVETNDTQLRRLAYFERRTASYVAHLARLKEAT